MSKGSKAAKSKTVKNSKKPPSKSSTPAAKPSGGKKK